MKAPAQSKFLVVDDNADLLSVTSQLFRTFGFSVLEADNGKTAWDLLQSNEIDLVLTDIRMPVLDGVQLLAKIRARDPVHPCVLVTSGFTDYPTRTLYHMGADGFLAKPFGAGSIREAAQQALLSKAELWSRPATRVHTVNLSQNFASFDQMLSSDKIVFGRGGFFLRKSDALTRVDAGVNFTFHFDGQEPVQTIEGTGIVRWAKSTDTASEPAGMGIEIKFLNGPGRELLCPWLEKQKLIAYIPSSH